MVGAVAVGHGEGKGVGLATIRYTSPSHSFTMARRAAVCECFPFFFSGPANHAAHESQVELFEELMMASRPGNMDEYQKRGSVRTNHGVQIYDCRLLL